MKKKGLLKKIDELYIKVTNVVIGDSPQGTNEYSSKIPKNLLGTLKDKVLTMGTPKDDSLLYKEVVKREKEAEKEDKRLEREEAKRQKEAAKKAKEEAKAQKETSKKTTKKKISTKIATEKETKPKIKKATAKKTSTKETTTNEKSTSAPKVVNKTKKSTPKSTVKKITATKTKSSTATKSSSTKTVSKTKAIPKGSKRDEKIALYIKDIKKHYGEVDENFVAIIVKNLGPSIYKKDAESVACSDPKELATVRKNFLMKKLGIDASQGVLDAAIQDVCTELKGVRTKYRATFYYALAKKFKKESVLS